MADVQARSEQEQMQVNQNQQIIANKEGFFTENESQAQKQYIQALYGQKRGGNISEMGEAVQSEIGVLQQSAKYQRQLSRGEGEGRYLNISEKEQALTEAYKLEAQALEKRVQWAKQRAGYAVSSATTEFQLSEQKASISEAYGSPTDIGKSIRAESGSLNNLLISQQKLLAATKDPGERARIQNEINQTQTNISLNPLKAIGAEYSSAMSGFGSQESAAQSSANLVLGMYGTGDKYSSAINNAITYEQAQKEASLKAANDFLATPGASKDSSFYKNAISQSEQFGNEIVQNKINLAGLYKPTVQLQTEETIAQGQVSRLGFGFGQPGNYRDAVESLLSVTSKNVSRVESQIESTKRNSNLTADQKSEALLNLESEHQSYLTQQAQLAYQSDMSYGKNLPSTSICGSAYFNRILPSQAELAKDMESRAPRVGARNLGYYNPGTGDRLLMPEYSKYNAAGQTPTTAKPGDLSAQGVAIAQAFAYVLSNHPITFIINGDRKTGNAVIPMTGQQNLTGSAGIIPGVSMGH